VQRLRPSGVDTFTLGVYTVRFIREASTVRAFTLTSGRVRNIRFDRVR
jgi:hypothetical protein